MITSTKGKSSKWIRIDQRFPIADDVKKIIEKLRRSGHVAYIVGGSVRDFLLGRTAKDPDIATDALPDQICELFPNSVTVGKAFGVLKIPVGEGRCVEVATFRRDLDYKDHRHPSKVEFGGPEEDAERRDFTVNALFFDPQTSRILDTVGGIEDLKAGVIRAIGQPVDRFEEDALRLLRAIRFTVNLKFRLDLGTQEAALSKSKLIRKISPERVRDELDLMLGGAHPDQALLLLDELELRSWVLPELDGLKGSAWKKTLKALVKLSLRDRNRSQALSWAAVFLRLGMSDRVETAKKTAERLKFSKSLLHQIVAVLETQGKFKEVFQMREATLIRFLNEPDFEDALKLHAVDALSTDGNLAFYDFCLNRFEALKKPGAGSTKLLSGEDLIQLGFEPGRRFSEILRAVEDLTLEKKLLSKEQALEYVVQHFVK